MSSFTTPAKLELLPDNQWRLLSSFIYYTGDIDNRNFIEVPEGFITDLASVPRIFWPIFPPNGNYAKAAIIHDYLYVNAINSKQYADNIFYEAMGVLNVPYIRKILIYYAVKLFGRGNYK